MADIVSSGDYVTKANLDTIKAAADSALVKVGKTYTWTQQPVVVNDFIEAADLADLRAAISLAYSYMNKGSSWNGDDGDYGNCSNNSNKSDDLYGSDNVGYK